MSDVTEVVNRNHQKKRPVYAKENPVAVFLAKTAAMFPHVMPTMLGCLAAMAVILIMASVEWFSPEGALMMAILVIVKMAFKFGQTWERVTAREVA